MAGQAGSKWQMDYHTLERVRQTHPGWRLLTATHAPLVASFLYRTFVEPNVRSVPRGDVMLRLDDYLQQLRDTLGAGEFPRSGAEYLDEWANDLHGWLRKYYPPDSDEPHFDLSSTAHAAIVWLSRLGQRQFVGTESRLMTVLDLLQQIAEGSEANPDARIARLEARRAEAEAEIARIRQSGQAAVLEPAQLRDRFQQMADTARAILSDFRDVEQSLRDLDLRMRERIATWEGGKGALVADMFGERDAIADSDTGRSFRAFWDFLMAPDRQDELTTLLERVLSLEAIQEMHPDPRIRRIHYEWLTAGELTQRTVARLSEQLRRFLDDQSFLESRRIVALVRAIEQHALAVRATPPTKPLMSVDADGPELQLPFERPLFTQPMRPRIEDQVLVDGDEDISLDALYEQVYVDKARLRARIRQALQLEVEVTLGDLVQAHPLEHGLAELVAYLSLATDDRRSLVDDARKSRFDWTDPRGRRRSATLPLVVFRR